jgi:hypothetical protein
MHWWKLVPDTMFRHRLICLLLVLITLLAYLPVTHHGFISLDDDLYVTINRLVQKGLTWAGVKWAFTTWHGSMWHPVTWLSHMLDCELFGVDAGAHLLAAEEDPGLRNGSAAVTLVERASALFPNQPLVLDVLGMAYAETRDFSNAQATASTAIDLAANAGMTNIQPRRQRLDLYKKCQPWRESFLSTNTQPLKGGKD